MTVHDDAPDARTPTSQRRATIQDVARAAGVSVSAVSKVVRGAYGVSPAMREKVTAAIDTLGYRPHTAARAMRGRSYTIGVMVVELSSPFQPEVAEGIDEELGTTPYQAVLVSANGVAPERQKRAVEALVDRQVDGLVLVAPWLDAGWLDDLGARIPTVVVAQHGTGKHYDTVVDDDRTGARLMVDHLVGLGHRSIVHTGQDSGGLEPPHVLSHTARQEGYEQAMRRHGLTPDVIVTGYTERGGYEAAMEALTRPDPPTAIFAGADIAALGALRATEELGLRVPGDVSIAGYDNIFVAGLGRISLTTIDQSGNLTGAVSARLLLERLEGRTEPANYVVAPRLIERSTSGPPRDGGA
jgi:LacI family transcriptional regulator